ncbi:hypothetical protein BGW38_000364 [Lunasporangiospora selenospora]|uniref:Amino acid transporter transmembrane domain-containing protein n=1 Tax=Lunasporangiospora selenospora TaxID=979761 RepID=A0A9P6KE92_9FUNG|nr:hypothetical protein BGW38_000364 [Lunasporangiospora selenospora]
MDKHTSSFEIDDNRQELLLEQGRIPMHELLQDSSRDSFSETSGPSRTNSRNGPRLPTPLSIGTNSNDSTIDPASSSSASAAVNNGFRRYSMGDSGAESGSDTTALPSNQHIKRTSSFHSKQKTISESKEDDHVHFHSHVSFDPDNLKNQQHSSNHKPSRSPPATPTLGFSSSSGHEGSYASNGLRKPGQDNNSDHDESDVDLDFGFSRRDYQDDHDFHDDSSTKVPLVSYKSQNQKTSSTKGGSRSKTTQPRRQGDYNRISNDSYRSSDHSMERDDEDDEGDVDFGQEEETVGMVSGNRTNRMGIGNRNGQGQGHAEIEAKLPDHGGSLFSSFLNMANSIIGADWTVGLLVHSAKLSGRTTYQDLLMFCFGKGGLIAISIFQFIFAFGVLISFPLSLYRDISKLAKTSAIAMVALVVIIIAVVIEGPRAPEEIRGDPTLVWTFVRPEVFQSIGVISFAFVCHHNSFLIFGSLQKPTINRVKLVTHMSMMVSLLACLILALSGFIAFSDKTQGNILNNFPSDNLIINIARFCFGVNMFTTLPLEAFVCREVIETYYFPGAPFSAKRHFLITTGLVGVALVIALLTCNLGFVLEVTGGFSATALAFILPPLCYLKLASGPTWSVKKIPHIACLLFGIAVMVLSTFFSLQHFLAPVDEGVTSTCSV